MSSIQKEVERTDDDELSRQTTQKSNVFNQFLSTLRSLALLDILLPFTIIICMVFSTVISVYVPSSRTTFDSNGTNLVGVSIPLAVGMIVMMIPPICKVAWENVHNFVRKPGIASQLMISLILNWIFGPLLMTAFAWLTLFQHTGYRQGIIMIGVARCIAMVLIWNEIAGGDKDLCVILVVINSLMQMVLYAPLQIFLCYVISGEHLDSTYDSMITEVCKSIGVFLGIPLGFGLLIRLGFVFTIGKERYEKYVLRFISPFAMLGFHYTLCVIFISRGYDLIRNIGEAILCFVPLVLYFVVAWFFTFGLMRFFTSSRHIDRNTCRCDHDRLEKKGWGSKTCDASYPITMTQCFTVASNNFELSLAVAVSIYGNDSEQAIAATFGPLLEVPILLILAILAKQFRHYLIWRDETNSDDTSPEEIKSQDKEEVEV